MNSLSKQITIVFMLVSGYCFAKPKPKNQALPPSWQTSQGPTVLPSPGSRPFYIGPGVGFPEIFTLDMGYRFNRFFALNLFLTPPIPFDIKVEMPADTISTKKGIGVANPEFDIFLKGTYGPNIGVDGLWFPFGETFFLFSGIATRSLVIRGEAESNILICPVADVVKNPPCPDPKTTITTRSSLALTADLSAQAVVLRYGLGWMSSFFIENTYVKVLLGATTPINPKTKVESHATINTQSSDLDQDVNQSLSSLRASKEADLNDKALHEVEPLAKKTLPAIGFFVGYQF